MMDLIINLTKLSFTAPRRAAERLLALSLDRRTIFGFFLIAVCLSVVAIYLSGGPTSGDLEQDLPMMASPIRLAIMILAVTVLSAIGIQTAGRFVGGQADFDRIMVVMAWQQWLQFLMQCVLGIFVVISMPIAVVLQFVVLWISFWIFFNMIRVAHGFDGILKSIFAVLVGSFLAILALGFVTMIFVGA